MNEAGNPEDGEQSVEVNDAHPIAEGERRQAEIDEAIVGIQALSSRAAQVSIADILSARDEGRR